MTETPSADDLARENERLRQENGELRDGLRTVVHRQAAAEAGLDPAMGRWVKGDTVDDALTDAHDLARRLDAQSASPTPAPSPEAAAIQNHLREARDDGAALHPDHDQTQEV